MALVYERNQHKDKRAIEEIKRKVTYDPLENRFENITHSGDMINVCLHWANKLLSGVKNAGKY